MSDFCYSWPVFNRVFRQAEVMDRMMERVGVRPAVAVRIDQGMAWYDARTKCIDCLAEQQCRWWLESADASAAPPDFCPNAQFFRECARNDATPMRQADERQAGAPHLTTPLPLTLVNVQAAESDY